jgi:tRNA A-37 threonylcarbamoyl transferase component Bud32/CheY-like chemotaxis protein
MKPTTAEELAHRAQELQLVGAAQLGDVWTELGGHNVPIEKLGAVLVRRELLTGYQLERLVKGERTGFFFGKAKLLYQIGAGSFARVFRAMNVEDGSILAVKVLRSRFSADAEKCRAFRREGEMGRLLRHPHIVAIEDVGQEGNTTYITMEFLEGQTLRELVRIRGAVDLPRALDLILQMVSGLEYAHRRGVTHRDLKASNVLVSSTGQAKLVDFGLAGVDAEAGDRHLDRTEQPRTVDYAALEKLSGMKDDSLRSDIYFLGTIAYLTLSGKPALAESRDRLVRSDPRRFTVVAPLGTAAAELPRDVVDVVGRMMQVDPLERWQTAADVRRALEPLVARHAAGGNGAARPGPLDSAEFPAPSAMSAERAATKGTLMVVETSQQAQDALRVFFTKLGYRVLVTENPDRALVRFSTTPLPADCLIMSTQSLGQAAVNAFNRLSSDPFFAAVPAILLTSPKQKALSAQAKLDGLRRVLETPVRTAAMTKLLDSLVKK